MNSGGRSSQSMILLHFLLKDFESNKFILSIFFNLTVYFSTALI